MARLVNEYWDDLDRDPTEEGVQFAQSFYGPAYNLDPRCHAIQSLAVAYDRFKEERGEPRGS